MDANHEQTGQHPASKLSFVETVRDIVISIGIGSTATLSVTAITFVVIAPLTTFGTLSSGDWRFGLSVAAVWGMAAAIPISAVTFFCPAKFRIFVAFEFAIMWAVFAGIFFSQVLHALANS